MCIRKFYQCKRKAPAVVLASVGNLAYIQRLHYHPPVYVEVPLMALYTLKVIADFASAHTLRDYPGACSRMHGHNWKVEANTLNSIGMAIDFKDIKREVRAIAEELDHQYLNDLAPFQTINPTAEHIARYFFQTLSQRLNDERVRVCALTIWETERACVRYAEG